MNHLPHRRHFLQAAGASTAAVCLQHANPLLAAPATTPAPARWPICCFVKPLQHLSFDQLADKVAEMGFQGIEATIRKGGQIEPEEAPQKLPLLVKALTRRDLKVMVMATDVRDMEQPHTESLLRTAADLGIQRYRMGYFTYQLDRPILGQLDEMAPKFQTLAAFNRKLGIQALYQNHANHLLVGGPVWDLERLLREIDPAEIAVAFDIRHATVEGGKSWPIEFKLIQPHLGAVYIKDFEWDGRDTKNVPLGEGLVDPDFFQQLKDSSFSGPISLHMEYVDHHDPELLGKSLVAIAKDMQALKKLLE